MRTKDVAVTDAILDAALGLLADRGFAGMTIEAVADAARVGKPAIYRRYANKVELTIAAIGTRLEPMDIPDGGDTRAEMHAAMRIGLPAEAESYLALIGGLAAEHRRHPELIAAFRDRLLLPRRAVGIAIVARGQQRGHVRPDLDPEMAIDLFAGPLLARAFAGRDTGPEWRERAFSVWWDAIRTR